MLHSTALFHHTSLLWRFLSCHTHTHTHTRPNFSRKVIAIALAAGVSLGGVTITVPTAGATAGIDGYQYIVPKYKLDENGHVILESTTEFVETLYGPESGIAAPTFGSFEFGGLYNNVNATTDDKTEKVSGFGVGERLGHENLNVSNAVYGDKAYGEPKELKDLRVKDVWSDTNYTEGTLYGPLNPDDHLPVKMQKQLAVITAIANDIAKNNGLSDELRAKFAENGYTGDFGEGYLKNNHDNGSPGYAGEKALAWEDFLRFYPETSQIPQTLADYIMKGLAEYYYHIMMQDYFGKNHENDQATIQNLDDSLEAGNFIETVEKMAESLSYSRVEEPGQFTVRIASPHHTDYDNKFGRVPLLVTSNPNIPSLGDLHTGKELHVTDVEELDNGNYKITRNDGESWTIDTSGNVSKIKPDGKGNLIVTIDGKDQTVPLDKVKITESNKGKKNHTITITTPDGASVVLDAYDNYVTDVKKDKDDNYTITRNDGKSWTINLADLNKRIGDLENKDTVSPDELKAVQDDLSKAEKDIAELKSKDTATDKTLDGLRKDISTLQPRVTSLEKRVSNLEKSTIKEVKPNGDGTYTLIRNDGSKVKGNIDTAGNVTKIVSDDKGNLVVTIDGKDQTVPLDQVKITESNKGKPNHTVTITTPDGKSVTFNVFDAYVTNVEKQADGNYKVTRNDGESWVINLKDIRDQIAALEAKDSPTRQEFNQVKKNIDTLKKNVDGLKTADKAIKSDIANIKTDITNLDNRITKVEARLTVVEDDTAAITKCIAGAGMAGIPTLLSIPLLMLTQVNIPGIRDLNTQIQKQIGLYNADAARAWEQNGGVLQAGAIVAGLAGMIGSIAYIADQCGPTMKTPAGQATDLGQLSSKLDGSDKVATKKKVTAQ